MRWIRRWALGLALFLVLLLGGTGAFFFLRDSGGYGSVQQLVGDLEAAGIVCEGLQVSGSAVAEEVGGEFGSCSIDGRTVNISVYYLDPDKVEEHIRNNVSVRGQSPNYFTSLVAGGNWIVDTYSSATAEKVKKALGGTIH